MVEQVTLQTIGILLTAVTVSIAALYYTLTLRYTRRSQDLQLETRKAQLFMQIYSRLDDNEFWDNYGKLVWEYEFESIDDFFDKYGPGTKTGGYAAYMSFLAFFGGIGVLIDKGLIDIDVVIELVGTTTKRVWEKVKPLVLEHRERFEYSTEAKWLEYLVNRIAEREGNIKN